jgi:hypothetical protein
MATYRVGNHQPQNLYRDDTYIGVMFDPQTAAEVVAAMNDRQSAVFWRGQYDLAANIAATLADLDDHDGEVANLKRLLRQEIERRKAAEHESDRLASVLMHVNSDECGCLGGLVSEWSQP